MAESLLQKAQRLGMQPAAAPVVQQPTQSTQGESLIQKAQRLGIQPANKPTTTPEAKPENNILQSLFVNTIGRPAVRAAETVSRGIVGAFGNDQEKQKLEERTKQPTKLPLGLGTVAPQKSFEEGGGKQILADTGKTALDIATLGEGSAVNATLKSTAEKAGAPLLEQLAKSKVGGYVAKKLPGIAANAAEGVAYNTGYNVVNGKPAFENTGSAAALSVALPPVINSVFKGAGLLLSKDIRGKNIQTSINKEVDEMLNKTKGVINKNQLATKKNTDLQEILSDPTVFKGLKVENQRINPDEALETIRNRKDALLDAKRTFLPEIDQYIPKTPKEVIRQKAIDDIKGKLTPADELLEIADIDKQLAPLPDELSSQEIDDLRARFRKSGRNAQGLQKNVSAYTALENASRDTVFEITDNLPFDTNKEYQAINNHIKDLINAEEFVDKTIRGQVVKGGRLGSLGGRVVGAIAGSGHGPLGTILGSELGGALSNILTNNQLGSSFKMRLVKELTDDPAIIQKAEELLNKAQNYKPLALPAPSSEFKSTQIGQKPIPLGKRAQSSIDRGEIDNIQRSLESQRKTDQTIPINNTPKSGIPKKIPSPVKKSSIPTKPAKLKGSAPIKTLLGGGIGTAAIALAQKGNKTTYTREEKPIEKKKEIPPEKLASALTSLESSGGTNKTNADKGELKWLTGLTSLAIKELKRLGIKKTVNVNDKKDVLDASVKYFELMQKKHPELTPAEIYVDKYWTQATSSKQRQEKIDEFNKLTQ